MFVSNTVPPRSARNSTIAITAAGIDALTVSPALSPRYAFAAPNTIPTRTPGTTAFTVNSGIRSSGPTYGGYSSPGAAPYAWRGRPTRRVSDGLICGVAIARSGNGIRMRCGRATVRPARTPVKRGAAARRPARAIAVRRPRALCSRDFGRDNLCHPNRLPAHP